MATRILVQCHSQDIPGDPKERRTTMANIICKHVWHRPFDEAQDRLQSLGQYRIEMPLNPKVTHYLRHFPFNGARTSSGYTDEEFKNTFGEEKYQAMLVQRIRQRLRWGEDLLAQEKAYLQDHPELATQL
ncbi:hypothetical protein MYCTH_2309539 [Thermothelomyces thermophilus ATCC 42464]|uniref:Uncharacterized protein n=1 Tax=Thermothelomyces thermophilus (strain ATCC 42464 / BCRC 31852 / DSM 1799) TaxID=573729 RepID=G2QIP1_THET4|nr:uncharacterized protein MYCTH_2309539 [Thermothelomyces thermophilus ATCC 42464]AEO60363.1 hypothetical protein MYCTH_2309539 [Thermothelomyces thermophilus ATCC 42464]